MLIWVCALHCEAKPVIDLYRLKKSHQENAFDLYLGDEMICIISGIGKLASATACAWIAARYQTRASLAWINLGTAGAAEHEIGSLFSLNQVIDADSEQRFYPAASGASLPGHACLTLARASQEYQDKYLFDMEASGFMFAALRFSSAELTQCIKVVSDNNHHQTGRDRQRVSELIKGHIETLHQSAKALAKTNRELAEIALPTESWQQLIELAHFSQTEKNRLRVLWRYLMNRDFSSTTLLQQLAEHKSGKVIINTLEQISHQDSENL